MSAFNLTFFQKKKKTTTTVYIFSTIFLWKVVPFYGAYLVQYEKRFYHLTFFAVMHL